MTNLYRADPSATARIAALPIVFAACLSVPLFLPIPGFETVPPLAIGVAILSIPVLWVQIGVDAVYQRPGSKLRLIALVLVLASTTSWIVGVSEFGANGGAALSLLNWIALMAIAVAGQMFLGTPQRISWLLSIWSTSYAVIGVVVVAYIAVRFGGDILTTDNRVPAQMALRGVFKTWPNYFGLALAVGVCIVYGRILSGSRGVLTRLQLVALVLALAVTFSRSAYLACVIGIATMTFVAGSRIRALGMLLGVAGVVSLALLFVPVIQYQFVATFIPGTSQNLGLLERLAFTREALLLWLDHPAFGIGFNRFADFSDESLVYSGSDLAPSQLGSVHNEFVTMLLKSGWVGVAAFLIFAFYGMSIFRSAIRHGDPFVRQQGVIAYGVCATLFSGGLVAESLRTIAVSAVYWVLVGALDTARRQTGLRAEHEALGGVVA